MKEGEWMRWKGFLLVGGKGRGRKQEGGGDGDG